MHKSQYSGMFGDYSSYSEEYEEMDDVTMLDAQEEEDAPREDGNELDRECSDYSGSIA